MGNPPSLLSESRCAVLEDAGYGVAVCSDYDPVLALLRVSSRPVVVLLARDDKDQSQQWMEVFNAARSLPRHAYLLLSSQHQRIPSRWSLHTKRLVPVLPLPFEPKLLLMRVDEAVRRLCFVVASTPG